MIILKQREPVGTLHPDGSIESQLPELRDLNEFWQTEGVFTYGGPLSEEVDGAIAEGASYRKVSAETLEMVIFELKDRGYEVVDHLDLVPKLIALN